jgi:hypothetical protein
MVAVVSSATFDALTFPMFSGLLFLIIGCAGAYLGLMRAQAKGPARNLLADRAQVPAVSSPGSTGTVSPGAGRPTRPPALPHPFFGPGGGETLHGWDRQRADHAAREGIADD